MAAVDVRAAVRDLLAGLVREPRGQVSPSVYETGRLASLAPWLEGHAERLDWLVAMQRPGGAWGTTEGGYALVPTLSAVEALLRALHRDGDAIARTRCGTDGIARAADAGLVNLFDWLGSGQALALPDLPAIELIVPSLIAAINRDLDGFGTSTTRLRPPANLTGAALLHIAERLSEGRDIDVKLLHAGEVLGESLRGATGVVPVRGAVGASPAATAAWLASAARPSESVAYLRSAIGPDGGPVPLHHPDPGVRAGMGAGHPDPRGHRHRRAARARGQPAPGDRPEGCGHRARACPSTPTPPPRCCTRC